MSLVIPGISLLSSWVVGSKMLCLYARGGLRLCVCVCLCSKAAIRNSGLFVSLIVTHRQPGTSKL